MNNNFREELHNQLTAGGLNEISIAAIMEHSGTLEGISKHGGNVPTVSDFQEAELKAFRESTPLTLAIDEMVESYKKDFQALSNVRQEALLEKIAEKVAPPENAFQERINQLETAFNTELQSGSVERATELYNELESLSEMGELPTYEKPKKTLPSNQEIYAMGASEVTALLREFPEHTRHILDIIND
ncbi:MULTISPECIES: hypothetical protein [Enterococcus]|uniref:hypothetical protein n=1 Tax=Enterococcus TaxID=1350 RepID=UPI000DE891A7|nr:MULTISPECIES: hypothetical protein [Enterococcus]MBE8830335.1 hypothetical protein [Enterococcus hirae]RBS35421.1 hypothetical protein EB15_02726 [Enterococcus faecium]